MALTYIDSDGALVIPGSYAKWETAPTNAGFSTTGVVVLVGEAETGPDFTSENPITATAFGPRQFGAIKAKYGSGPLVDAAKVIGAPSKDAQVKGAPNRLYFIKTNKGTKSEKALSGAYAELQARLEGEAGNLISYVCTQANGKATITIARKYDSISDTKTFGGDVTFKVRAQSAVAVGFTIDATKLTSAGAAGVGALDITLAKFKTLNDLAAYISAQQGWTAQAVPLFGQMKPSSLDQGTYAAATEVAGTFPAQVKKDAYDFVKAIGESRLAAVKTAPTAGLPPVQTLTFFASGTRGTTSDQDVIDALAAAGKVRANFVVSLFSRDATDDITDGETDSGSAYTIASVNAAVADHVARMSQFKQRRPRQGFVSIRDSYANAKSHAQTLASFRVACNFLDVNALGAAGLKWFQPWMGSVLAAGMQAAGFYRPLFHKALNISGVRHNTNDFDVSDIDAVEDALLNGLMVIQEREEGGFIFSKDNTTYGADENFVLNSVQAVYVADTIGQTASLRMEKAFTGQSFADVSAGVAASYFKGIMASLKKAKLVAASDDAPAGYKDLSIDIRPPAMIVSAEVKEATGLYFVPIRFLVTEVQQSARG